MKTATAVCSKLHLTTALGLLALTAAGAANAACMSGAPHQSAATNLARPTLIPSLYHPDTTTGSLLKTDFFGGYDEGIVGLWQFQLGPFPGPDWGTQAWHADGTELMFSGGQNPQTGDICQGVWRQIGRDTFTLNHIAMGWDVPGGGFGLRFHLHFVIKLNPSGTAFSGTYSGTGYCESGTLPPFPIPSNVTCVTPNPFFEYDPKKPISASNPNNVVVPTGTGTVTATRVVPD